VINRYFATELLELLRTDGDYYYLLWGGVVNFSVFRVWVYLERGVATNALSCDISLHHFFLAKGMFTLIKTL